MNLDLRSNLSVHSGQKEAMLCEQAYGLRVYALFSVFRGSTMLFALPQQPANAANQPPNPTNGISRRKLPKSSVRSESIPSRFATRLRSLRSSAANRILSAGMVRLIS